MMLYDRLFRHAVSDPESFGQWDRVYRNLPVYELTNVIPLVEGMMGRKMEIPTRPPHEDMWCEWECVHHPENCSARVTKKVGFLIHRLRGEAFDTAKADWPSPRGWVPEDIYGFVPFDMFTSVEYLTEKRLDEKDWMFGQPTLRPSFFEYAFFDNYLHHEGANQFIKKEREFLIEWGQANLGVPVRLMPEEIERTWFRDAAFGSWPAMLCFGLLHCKNVVVETDRQDKKHPMIRGEREHRPYCSYKVLKLEVPRRMAERNGDDVEGGGTDEPKIRFHLCRGHFKNLQHPRYKSKGWHWWPAHWKGSVNIGRVEKTYELKPSS